jgi:hypothetical protein
MNMVKEYTIDETVETDPNETVKFVLASDYRAAVAELTAAKKLLRGNACAFHNYGIAHHAKRIEEWLATVDGEVDGT